jgi:hypothetical protein
MGWNINVGAVIGANKVNGIVAGGGSSPHPWTAAPFNPKTDHYKTGLHYKLSTFNSPKWLGFGAIRGKPRFAISLQRDVAWRIRF